MPWDLRWDQVHDLEFSPSYDIAITGGEELVQQRILLRLQMMRGWIYDDRGDLGSRLFESLSNTVDSNYDSIPPLVLEALEPMSDEIIVDDVMVTSDVQDNKSLQAVIVYHLIATGTAQQPQSFTVSFPLS